MVVGWFENPPSSFRVLLKYCSLVLRRLALQVFVVGRILLMMMLLDLHLEIVDCPVLLLLLRPTDDVLRHHHFRFHFPIHSHCRLYVHLYHPESSVKELLELSLTFAGQQDHHLCLRCLPHNFLQDTHEYRPELLHRLSLHVETSQDENELAPSVTPDIERWNPFHNLLHDTVERSGVGLKCFAMDGSLHPDTRCGILAL